MAQDPNQNRPADVAQADSVGGMAKRLPICQTLPAAAPLP